MLEPGSSSHTRFRAATPLISARPHPLGSCIGSSRNPKLNTENDADEFGKGHEFATQTFKTSWDVNGTLEKYLGAEIAAWAMAYGLGKVAPTGSAPNFIYTCTPPFPAAGDASELPFFSFIEQIRPGAATLVVDRMAVGCAVEAWTITIGSGPGRANSKINIEFVGSGLLTEPSGLVIPAVTAEKLLPSASLTLTINGVDYVTAKNIISLETGWKNNIRMDAGFYPGSGFQAWAGKLFTVDAGTDVFTSAAHGLQNDAEVTVSGADLPAGLTAGVVYHVIAAATDTLQLSLTEGGTAVLMSDAGTPPHTMTVVPATTGAIRGRMEFGNRQGTLKFVARFEHDSPELALLKSQTKGTAVIGLSFDANNSLQITWQQVSFAIAEVGDTDGIVTVSVECATQYHPTNGVITAVAKCNVDDICA